LAPAIATFGGPQAFIFCTVLLCFSIACAAVRVSLLTSLHIYWYFVGIFALWGIANLLFLSGDSASRTYFWIFCISTSLTWFFYLVAGQSLYRNVFSGYPGIASFGKWIVAAAALCILLTGSTNYYFFRGLISPGWLYTTITMIDRSLLFGVTLFFVLLVVIMSRYPISIPRNLLVHCIAFSGLLLIQALISLLDQWAAHQFTAALNNVSSLVSASVLLSWSRFLTRGGEITIVRVRQRLDPEVEFRLLGQLHSINGILLRASRK
jgi:hypothetical protein